MQRSVLVVDDSKLARMAIAAAVGRLRPDWRIVEAGNADEARQTLASNAVDVVLIDFNMPGTDGLTFAGELRAERQGTPIAIITANIQDEIVRRAREIDATFVPKPLTDDALAGFLSGAELRLRRA